MFLDWESNCDTWFIDRCSNTESGMLGRSIFYVFIDFRGEGETLLRTINKPPKHRFSCLTVYGSLLTVARPCQTPGNIYSQMSKIPYINWKSPARIRTSLTTWFFGVVMSLEPHYLFWSKFTPVHKYTLVIKGAVFLSYCFFSFS